MKFGFIKVATASPLVRVADCFYNILQIENLIRKAAEQGAELIVFPELSVTGYTCMDLFTQETLLHNAEKALDQLVEATSDLSILCIVGMPLFTENQLYNTAVVFQEGHILGVVPKTYLSNYKEFQEERWFASAGELENDTVKITGHSYPIHNHLLFSDRQATIGIEICEDLWVPIPPSSILAMQGANILVNLSASNELIGKNQYLESMIRMQSAKCIAGYVYASSGFGESSTDLVFVGKGFIAENGILLGKSERFSIKEKLLISEIDLGYLRNDRQVTNSFMKGYVNESYPKPTLIPFVRKEVTSQFTRTVDPHPFIPSGKALDERCEEILQIQVSGLAKRLLHTHAQHAVIGISGGLDSTLALLVTVLAMDEIGLSHKQIIGVTMPGFGTTDRTYLNARQLINTLGATLREISIKEACVQHFEAIGHDINVHDITYENSQARERTQILMDLANKENGLVIGTGDLSELALGWATYNGDHMSMYGVNSSIPKTLVKYLVEWAARNRFDGASKATLLDIVDTPISPELLPADADGSISQITEDIVGPYELHDFFLYHFMRYGASPAKIYFLAQQTVFDNTYPKPVIRKWLRTFFCRFFAQQFKRSCLPDGPKVGSISLSPRGDWRMPSDAMATLWLKEIDELEE